MTTLTVRARDTSRAADLLAWALDLGAGIRNGSVAGLGPWVTTRDDVVVSTLPGSAGEVAAAGVPAAHPGVLLDVVYAGWPTPIARAASGGRHDRRLRARHARSPGGEQFRLFTGHEAPVEAMAAAGRAALGQA